MTSVTQKIPNFAGGISQQPDELMPQGSVRDAVNVVPDVTDGLRKRTGSRLINPLLTDQEGTWFNFDYAPGLKFIGKVGLDGRVNMFYAQDGQPAPVFYQNFDPNTDTAGSLIESQFPGCDQAAVTAKRNLYKDKAVEKSAVERQYNVAISESRVVESQEYFEAHEGYYKGDVWYPPIITQGYAEYSDGKIFSFPQPDEGWTARKGQYKFTSFVGAELAEDTVGIEDRERVDVYEYVWERSVGGADQQTIDDLKAQLDTLSDEIKVLYDDYAAELAKCGYPQPGEETPELKETFGDVLLKYLEHEKGGQLRVLSVGDTVFFTNPNQNALMLEGSARPERPNENFIEIIQAAAAKVYAVELVTPDSGPTPFSVVTGVSITNAKFRTDGSDGCNLVGTERETFEQGDKKNLDLTLTVTGSAGLDGDDDPECNYIATIDINNGGTGWVVGDAVTMNVQGRDYVITVTEVKTKFTSQGKPITPAQTPSDGQVVEASDILANLAAEIEKEDGFQTTIVGNGIHITNTDPDAVFTFATPEGQLMRITTTEVNNIAELPSQCVDGYLAKVINSDSEFDDYWVEFETEYGDVNGPGAWVETVGPGYNKVINPATMPHKMVRNAGGLFIVSPISWEPRNIGDDISNPLPSFLSRTGKGDFRQINAMAFFRNRLCMLSGDRVICSQPGDYFNFWRSTALTLSDSDPIDLQAGSTATTFNSVFESAIEIAEGLLCFSNSEQHVLSTDSEVFGPRTARFSRVGTYRYRGPKVSRRKSPSDGTTFWSKTGTEPISLGNSIAFLHDSGLHSTMLEMYNIGRAQEATVNDLTKPIPRYLPFGINSIADSKDNNIIALTVEGTQDVWVYRYFDDDQERKQSAWFRWTTLGKMLFQCIMDDVYWYVSIGTSSNKGFLRMSETLYHYNVLT